MNRSIIRYILGWGLKLESIFLLLPFVVGLCYREYDCVYFLIIAAVAFFLGNLLTIRKPKKNVFYIKEGCMATALTWILISVVGCLPLFFSGAIPRFTDALFETISGFTTTGTTILSSVEDLSKCMNMWRCFTHWIGGMGVLVFLLAVIQTTGGSNMNLMKAESPGPSVGKLVPRVMHSARLLYVMYVVLSISMLIFMLCGRVSLYDSLAIVFSTAGTGGFGVYNNSLASFSPYIHWVVTIYMILFGVNFNAIYLVIFGKAKEALKSEEVRCYLIIIGAAVLFIMLGAYDRAMSFGSNLREVTFQVASIISTTGFSTLDFDKWPEMAKIVLTVIMFIGGCAGSTSGGLKVSRLIMMFKNIIRELRLYLYPKQVKKVKLDGRTVGEEMLRAVGLYFAALVMVFIFSVFLVSLNGYDFETSFSAVAATLSNTGPGFHLVGPTCNFGFLSGFTKYVLMFDMLAGRLELFPMLLLLYPPTWKGLFHRQKV